MDSILVSTSIGYAVRPAVADGFPRVADMTPDRHRDTRVLNACGEFKAHLHARHPGHRAWQKVLTLFGSEYQAYTVAGNLSLQIQHMVFKGATDPDDLAAVAATLFADVVEPATPMVPYLQLVVLQASVGRSLFVKTGCLLDVQLEQRVPWASLCSRCEELCNVVPFAITDWDAAGRALDFPAIDPPDTATVSVTRRGVMTLRLTWVSGIAWTSNAAVVRIAETIARFVHDLV